MQHACAFLGAGELGKYSDMFLGKLCCRRCSFKLGLLLNLWASLQMAAMTARIHARSYCFAPTLTMSAESMKQQLHNEDIQLLTHRQTCEVQRC